MQTLLDTYIVPNALVSRNHNVTTTFVQPLLFGFRRRPHSLLLLSGVHGKRANNAGGTTAKRSSMFVVRRQSSGLFSHCRDELLQRYCNSRNRREKKVKEFENKTKNAKVNYLSSCRNELSISCSSTNSSPSKSIKCQRNEGFFKFPGRTFSVHLFCF